MDNLWPITTSLIFTPITNEFNPTRPPLLTLSQNIGLLAGAMFWGVSVSLFVEALDFLVSSTTDCLPRLLLTAIPSRTIVWLRHIWTPMGIQSHLGHNFYLVRPLYCGRPAVP